MLLARGLQTPVVGEEEVGSEQAGWTKKLLQREILQRDCKSSLKLVFLIGFKKSFFSYAYIRAFHIEVNIIVPK